MRAVADIQVAPMRSGVPARQHLHDALALLRTNNLKIRVHTFGTEVEGELEEIVESVVELHHALHARGVARLDTTIKIQTSIEEALSLEEQVTKHAL